MFTKDCISSNGDPNHDHGDDDEERNLDARSIIGEIVPDPAENV